MITLENQEKLQALESNGEFQKSLENAETPDDVQRIMAQYGVEMSVEEIRQMIQEPEGELQETDLEDVSGGCGPGCRRGFRIKWVRIPPSRIPVPVFVPYHIHR